MLLERSEKSEQAAEKADSRAAAEAERAENAEKENSVLRRRVRVAEGGEGERGGGGEEV